MRPPAYRPSRPDHEPPGGERHVVVFDGGCGMCQGWVRRLKRWDRRQALSFVPLQDPSVAERFPWVPQDAFNNAMQLVAPDGDTWEGAGAAEKITALLPGGRPVSWIFRIPLVRPVADRVYRWVADNRGTTCSVHGGDAH